MFETVMVVRAERGAARRRELATDPLLARLTRHGDRRACDDEVDALAPSRRSRAAPATPAPRQTLARAA